MKNQITNNITVFAPATVANVGCGFDVFAFALEYPGDEIRISLMKDAGIRIKNIADDVNIPLEPDKNTAGVALIAMLRYLNENIGIEVEFRKKMPLRSGLGSSAASAVASVFALNHLLDLKLDNKMLLDFAVEGEKITSGPFLHLDNVSACLYGGFIIIKETDPPDIVSVPVPDNLYCVIFHPHVQVDTGKARQMLPDTIPMEKAIKHWGNTAALIAGFYKSDYGLIRKSITDLIVEPLRASAIPHFQELQDRALHKDALGCSISGSGPSVFALAEGIEQARLIELEMKTVYQKFALLCDTYVSKINPHGPKIIIK